MRRSPNFSTPTLDPASSSASSDFIFSATKTLTLAGSPSPRPHCRNKHGNEPNCRADREGPFWPEGYPQRTGGRTRDEARCAARKIENTERGATQFGGCGVSDRSRE